LEQFVRRRHNVVARKCGQSVRRSDKDGLSAYFSVQENLFFHALIDTFVLLANVPIRQEATSVHQNVHGIRQYIHVGHPEWSSRTPMQTRWPEVPSGRATK